jgi:pimeloyl-ACP methyl ester carboxylesterase
MMRIRCPALIVCGREDSWAPVQRHLEMSAAIAGSTFAEIPDCGHMCTMERPEAVSAAMKKWFESVIAAQDKQGRSDPGLRQPTAQARAAK